MKRRLSACSVWVFVCFILLSLATRVQAQVAFKSAGSDTIKIVKILNDEIYHSEQIDSVTTITTNFRFRERSSSRRVAMRW